jgi:histidinol-phosphate aminotransferase
MTLIQLGNNENSLGASPHAIDAAHHALREAHRYPDDHSHQLKQALAKHLSITSKQITTGHGSENILELIIKSFLQKNDNVIISQYTFLTIPLLLSRYGIAIKEVKASYFAHDIDKMIEAIDESTRMIFLVNPNNPTGTYTTANEFTKLMQSVPNDILVVVDEAYFDYVLEEDYPNTIDYLNLFPNLIITRTFSKAYGLAGLRIGYALSSSDKAEILNQNRLPFNINRIAHDAACAALDDKEHIKQTIQFAKKSMSHLKEGLDQLGIVTSRSVCNFLIVPVFSADLYHKKLLQKNIVIKPLTAYQLPNYIRVTLGTLSQNDAFLIAFREVIFTHTTSS